MRHAASLACLIGLAALSVGATGDRASREHGRFFNGTNLDGWDGLPQFWSVKDGALVGTTHPKGNSFNTFLCSRREYQDFELSFQVRLTGQGWTGNSGVQIRSKVLDRQKWVVAGPQCDIGETYWGSLYGERVGGMMKQAPADVVRKVLKPTDFNDYAIKVVGRHVTIRLNGATTVDQDFPTLPARGIIAWQLHEGPPMQVVFRNIRFREVTR